MLCVFSLNRHQQFTLGKPLNAITSAVMSCVAYWNAITSNEFSVYYLEPDLKPASIKQMAATS